MTSGITTYRYNDIGYNNIGITTLNNCPERFSIYCHTKSFGYNDILNNDTSLITTHISGPKTLNRGEYDDKYSSLTVLESPLKKIAQHISRLVPRRQVTKHGPVKTCLHQHTVQPHVHRYTDMYGMSCHACKTYMYTKFCIHTLYT